MLYAMLLVVAALAEPGLHWKEWKDGTGDYSLMQGETQVGYLRAKDGQFFPRHPLTGKFGEACPPPIEPPFKNFGLILSDRPNHRFTSRGQQVSEDEAFASLRDDPRRIAVPEDAAKLRVVVIGHDGETSRVQGLWDSDKALSPFRDAMLFSTWHPDDWQIAEYGFHRSGSPVIYCLAPDGEVLHRQDDFEGGASALAEALRQADSDYQARKDRDRRRAVNGISAALGKVPLPAWALGALMVAGAGYVMLRRKG